MATSACPSDDAVFFRADVAAAALQGALEDLDGLDDGDAAAVWRPPGGVEGREAAWRAAVETRGGVVVEVDALAWAPLETRDGLPCVRACVCGGGGGCGELDVEIC